MKKKQIAAQGYTIRTLCGDYAQADAAFDVVRKIGYESIQLSGQWHIGVAALAELTKKHGLSVCATHIGFPEIQADLQKVIADHKLLGCEYVGIGGMPQEVRGSLAACRAFVKNFNEAGLRLKDAGLTLIYHNHSFELAPLEDACLMDVLFEEGDPEAFQFEIDTYWIQNAKQDPVDWIRKVGGRMECVHFKDMQIENGTPIYCEIGEGVLDWPEIIRACRDIGVKWYIVEQDTCKGNPLDSLALSYRNMLKML